MNNLPNQKTSIKNWAIDDRPREKAISKGLEALSDAELIAILLGNGTTNKSALDLAKELLDTCDKNLEQLARKDISQISKSIKGIGPAKATTIVVALELGRRKNIAAALEKKVFLNSKQVADFFIPILGDKNIEEFYIVFLNNANKLISYQKHSTGGSTSTIVEPKLIVQKCLNNNAKNIFIIHNHPSGQLQPSQADFNITQKIKTACNFFDIIVKDHIIITNNGYYSFADEGKMH